MTALEREILYKNRCICVNTCFMTPPDECIKLIPRKLCFCSRGQSFFFHGAFFKHIFPQVTCICQLLFVQDTCPPNWQLVFPMFSLVPLQLPHPDPTILSKEQLLSALDGAEAFGSRLCDLVSQQLASLDESGGGE